MRRGRRSLRRLIIRKMDIEILRINRNKGMVESMVDPFSLEYPEEMMVWMDSRRKAAQRVVATYAPHLRDPFVCYDVEKISDMNDSMTGEYYRYGTTLRDWYQSRLIEAQQEVEDLKLILSQL